MDKILVVAATEFGTAVRSKAFFIGVLVFPLITFGLSGMQVVLMKKVDTRPREFAVLDRSGALYPALERRAAARNHAIASQGLKEPQFLPSPVEAAGRALDDVRLELSDRVRREELSAFVEIPEAALADEPPASAKLLYHSDHPTDDDLRRWVEPAVNDEIRTRRYRAAGLEPALVAKLDRRLASENLGLLARGPDGRLRPAERVNPIRAVVVPLIFVAILWILVITSAPILLYSVVEEKLSRISEVLLGAVTPFELMMGKLIGSVGVMLVLALIYCGGGLAYASYKGYADSIPFGLLPYFLLFLTLAVFLFGSLFAAIGAACSDYKDSQNLLRPVLILMMLPAFAFTAITKSPSSPLAVGMSLFPPATPFVMLLRMALHPAPPLWQVALSVVLTVATTVVCVWASGKIFRVGMLLQGKSANYAQMLRWVMS